MTASIHIFPARRCAYIYKTFCLYAEHANPGANTACYCSEQKRLEILYEELLDIAEQNKLTATGFANLWQERSANIYASPLCLQYQSTQQFRAVHVGEEGEQIVDCLQFREGLCLHKMPLCTGICTNYSIK